MKAIIVALVLSAFAAIIYMPMVGKNACVGEYIGQLAGDYPARQPLKIATTGPAASESDVDPNPFLDYRYVVTFFSPDNERSVVHGFFTGGDQWRAIFVPDEPGTWRYCISLRAGSNIAVSENSGVSAIGDRRHGSINVGPPAGKGYAAYVGAHYQRFLDGSYYLKGGTDSPENFLGYAGFDNTHDQGGIIPNFLHYYAPHVNDWQPGDPNWIGDRGVDGKGIIGAINYLAGAGVNSIYFLPMNLGGDGQETYPFVGASGSHYDNTHYDLSKLDQWTTVLEHANYLGIGFNIVLNETELANRNWLDGGNLGVQRKLFYREMSARFGHLSVVKWNLSEENVFSPEHTRQFATYLDRFNWARHPITFHSLMNDHDYYNLVLGEEWVSATSQQFLPDSADHFTEYWRLYSVIAGRPWIVDMDEAGPWNTGLTDTNADDRRKRVLYDVYFSGGQIEWYFGYHELPLGGDMRTENFRTRAEMWTYMKIARDFMETMPFWELGAHDTALIGEDNSYGGGQVFADFGVYAVYLPDASNAGAVLSVPNGDYLVKWVNPRTGDVHPLSATPAPNGFIVLGPPPAENNQDWIFYAERNP